uniref:DUF4371 domain-containing protein n=1 Tax=Chromera velia CCMP2878 TaxID=1169474 RepID=A0A0G4HAQ0_9ALVE|eukprot:Cvel_25725.t1-p1 / transcript=Cvel_25725.t1 / gene=Cvel_25725 / organism=Chromera_velia_CCMP2878 / gene_product=hypothetical protein / transcript_product=hypothetical protein / location=Cvel_scaffold2955:15861-19737(+) / protein_length=1025 / sequence_SO=supercontig / SO=protein_coding / is_pseudo=false
MGAKPVPGKYVNKDEAGGEMVKCLSDALFEHRAEKVRKSPVFGVSIDEGTDRTKEPHLSSVVRFIDGRRLVTVKWELAGVNGKNASAINRSLRASLVRGGVDEKKCGAFGSDGAAVMRGRLNGVDKKFEQTAGKVVSSHCAPRDPPCHSFCRRDGSENAKEADTTIRALHVLAKSSDDNICIYLEVEVTDLEGERQSQLRFDRCLPLELFNIRWLSRAEAVERVQVNYARCIKFLRAFRSVRQRRRRRAQRNGDGEAEETERKHQRLVRQTLQRMDTGAFYLWMCIFSDLLHELAQCNKSLQKVSLSLPDLPSLLLDTLLRIQAFQDDWHCDKATSKCLQAIDDAGGGREGSDPDSSSADVQGPAGGDSELDVLSEEGDDPNDSDWGEPGEGRRRERREKQREEQSEAQRREGQRGVIIFTIPHTDVRLSITESEKQQVLDGADRFVMQTQECLRDRFPSDSVCNAAAIFYPRSLQERQVQRMGQRQWMESGREDIVVLWEETGWAKLPDFPEGTTAPSLLRDWKVLKKLLQDFSLLASKDETSLADYWQRVLEELDERDKTGDVKGIILLIDCVRISFPQNADAERFFRDRTTVKTVQKAQMQRMKANAAIRLLKSFPTCLLNPHRDKIQRALEFKRMSPEQQAEATAEHSLRMAAANEFRSDILERAHVLWTSIKQRCQNLEKDGRALSRPGAVRRRKERNVGLSAQLPLTAELTCRPHVVSDFLFCFPKTGLPLSWGAVDVQTVWEAQTEKMSEIGRQEGGLFHSSRFMTQEAVGDEACANHALCSYRIDPSLWVVTAKIFDEERGGTPLEVDVRAVRAAFTAAVETAVRGESLLPPGVPPESGQPGRIELTAAFRVFVATLVSDVSTPQGGVNLPTLFARFKAHTDAKTLSLTEEEERKLGEWGEWKNFSKVAELAIQKEVVTESECRGQLFAAWAKSTEERDLLRAGQARALFTQNTPPHESKYSSLLLSNPSLRSVALAVMAVRDHYTTPFEVAIRGLLMGETVVMHTPLLDNSVELLH